MDYHIYTNGGRTQFAVAKQPVGELMFQVFGPTSFAACAAQMKAMGIPGW